MRRWEFREDRFNLKLWAISVSPSQNIAYSYSPMGLLIKMDAYLVDGKLWRIERVISRTELYSARLGWRWLVAQRIKQARYALNEKGII